MANIFNPSKPHFTTGRAEVYLPRALITLIHTPTLPPRFAKFHVPLNWNKLDLRDYLFHAYKVRTLSIRSWVYQPRPIQKDGAYHRWSRPRAEKRMIVEMEKPFVWPAPPTDMEPWSQDTFNERERERAEQEDSVAMDRAMLPPPEREVKSIREQARELLSGKTKWQPTWLSLQKMREGEAAAVTETGGRKR